MATASLTTPRRSLISIPRSECLLLEQALTREWLETNGRNAYASSTILMCPTRRYHGLLVAPYGGGDRRHVFLGRFEETLHGGDMAFPISMARYPDRWAPAGHQSIDSFHLVPYPSSFYRIGPAIIQRDILMVRGADVVLCRYRLLGERGGISLRLQPVLPYRPADSLSFENMDLNPRIERIAGGARACPYHGMPAIAITCAGGDARFEADPLWYRRVELRADIARGYDGHEDQFSPGWLSVKLDVGQEIVVSAALGDPPSDPMKLWEDESARRRDELKNTSDDLPGHLSLAAEHFLYSGANGRHGVIAGFPWFGEYGRDTFIALPGLTLARAPRGTHARGARRGARATAPLGVESAAAVCGRVLADAVPYLKDGLLPSMFGVSPASSFYGAADPALWFARAVRLYERQTGATDEVREFFREPLVAIAERYAAGTALGIHTDDRGLLHAGGPGMAVTWMDARTPEGPVTPRTGCPVEINALWYFLLAYLERLHGDARDSSAAERWRQEKLKTGRAFLERFWLEPDQYLADVWHDGVADRSVRPNMVIAASLEFSPLIQGKRCAIVKRAEVELITPHGLRSLAPRDRRYQGRYMGPPEARDAACHQGAAWPWLAGFFAEAYLRAFGFAAGRVAHLRELMGGLNDQLSHQGLNHISELCEGDPPHRPGGSIAQAWSTGEILRAFRLLDEGRL